MKIARESIDVARRSGLEALQAAHWREVAVDKGDIPLDVDWPRYQKLENENVFVGFTMRDGGTLCGYNAFFIMPHLHYKTTIFAVNDVIYLAPQYRGLDGVRFILEAERALAGALGVQKVLYHSKENVFFSHGARGRGAPDSLDVLDRMLELEEEYGIQFSQSFGGDDLTFGGLLAQIGYTKEETTWGKLLKVGA